MDCTKLLLYLINYSSKQSNPYLLKLKEDYANYYQSLKNDGHHVLWIDTTKIDFVENPDDYAYVLEQINELIGGK